MTVAKTVRRWSRNVTTLPTGNCCPRERIGLLLVRAGLAPFAWPDPILTAGLTRVRLSHLLELREALAAAYRASGRAGPVFTDVTPMSGTTPIRAVHLTELRAAVVALQ